MPKTSPAPDTAGEKGMQSTATLEVNIAYKNLRKSTQRLEKEIISYNKPLRGGNLLLPHLNVQVQDDSK
jgi:hypothetical protein